MPRVRRFRSVAGMGKQWTEAAVAYVLDTRGCPRCDAEWLEDGCPNCGVTLTVAERDRLAVASRRAASALEVRQGIIDRLLVVVPAAAPAGALATTPPAATPPLEAARGTAGAGLPSSGSQVSVQSVLAVAGAGLLAVAAFVFTFLNPDLTNFGTRTAIVTGVTVVFLGGSWRLARSGLRFSAESVGALGAVFVALDVWAFAQLAPIGVSGWEFGGIGLLASSTGLVALARLARIRSWLWLGLVGAAITPAFFGNAVGSQWATILGHVGVAVATLVTAEVAPRIWRRRAAGDAATTLRADVTTASLVRILTGIVVLVELFDVFLLTARQSLEGPVVQFGVPGQVVRIAAVVLVLGAIAARSARIQFAWFWSFCSGALFVAGVVILPFALNLHGDVWYVALAPAAAAAGLAAVCLLPRPSSVRPGALFGGAWAIALAVTMPALAYCLRELAGGIPWPIAVEGGAAAAIGLAAASGSSYLVSVAARRAALRALATAAATLGLWLSVAALVTGANGAALSPVMRLATGLALALALAAALLRMPRVVAARTAFRLPLIVGAHLAVLFAAGVAAREPSLSVIGGLAAAATLLPVSRTVPRAARPGHVGAAYGWALLVCASGLSAASLPGVSILAMLCIITSLAAIVGLVATLVRRLSTDYWYAILGITSIPFLVGVASVLVERSGWTALSTGVMFALALTLLLTRRPGLGRVVRSIAAALLVPALAVVVTCLGAQLLDTSGSPVVLPVIAGILAAALTLTGVIAGRLVRRGIPQRDARAARFWIEASSLVTAALAVLLSLVRAAAGLQTTLLVFLILGLGGAATALVARRRYGWVLAAASFTGALWSLWGLLGVTVIEAYLLPPALGAVLVGAIGTARGSRRSSPLFLAGLITAVVPTLGALALPFLDDGAPARVLGLAVGAALLLGTGSVFSRLAEGGRLSELSTLRLPTLLLALVAAAGPVVDALRFAAGIDPLNSSLGILPVLGLSVAASLLAGAGGVLLAADPGAQREGLAPSRRVRSRWLLVPASVYLVAAPILAVRPGWYPMLSVWILSLVLLVIVLGTVIRAGGHSTILPPVWLTFGLALATSIAAWSQRELRVEAFSLPLGIALLAAGVIAMRQAHSSGRPTLTTWPIGFRGSWRLLVPGILVTLGPSVLATGTDPQTWRAILVIALALVAILIGSLRRLAAPFILGVVVLPIENLVVFVVQIGRSIGAAPWWITLASAGAVLLVIAVTYEQRSRSLRGTSARLRDLG
ncbi:MAG: hypothetical protein JWQ12_814 [Glaciihabitans sp.]|nr:hypothetical protein [Glaciihabitans sp.]